MDTLSCKRCENAWIRRMEKLPVRCPRCGSPYWQKERQREKKRSKDGDAQSVEPEIDV